MKYSKTPNLAGDFPYFDAARLPGPVRFFTPVCFFTPAGFLIHRFSHSQCKTVKGHLQ